MKKQDIVIVGSGCAGLFAALQFPADKRITMITKEVIEHSDSFLAQGGICVLKTPERITRASLTTPSKPATTKTAKSPWIS